MLPNEIKPNNSYLESDVIVVVYVAMSLSVLTSVVTALIEYMPVESRNTTGLLLQYANMLQAIASPESVLGESYSKRYVAVGAASPSP